MNRVLHFFSGLDLYEVHLRGTTIARVVTYVGDSKIRHELKSEEVTPQVIDRIVKEFNKENE